MTSELGWKISGNVVNLVKGTIVPATLTIRDGRIRALQEEPEQHYDTFLLPGFVDAHVHIESSMLPPQEFARLVLPHGTIAAVADPHEIANVLGGDGVRYMLTAAKESPLRFAFGVPSCVPATTFETAGATLDAHAVEKLLAEEALHFLSEVMNVPGVLGHDPSVVAKIAAAQQHHKPIDGHAPALRGDAMRNYVAAGITTDHECVALEEALEKCEAGQKIALREGSAAKNLDALLPLLQQRPAQCFFCTDDAHPDDLLRGHINVLAQRAIAAGYDPIAVLRAACRNPVLHYELDVGQLQLGDRADFIEVSSLTTLRVLRTYIGGALVAENGLCKLPFVAPSVQNRFARSSLVTEEQFALRAREGKLRVLVAHDGSLLTDVALETPRIEHGILTADPTRDLLLLSVVNRYEEAAPAVAFARGFGLTTGAIASSVAHDSHNIVAVGATPEALARAINAVIETKGGLALFDGNTVHTLPLPIAGLMSDRAGEEVGNRYAELTAMARKLGSTLRAPFMTLSFMALLVIPRLKLSDRGLFSGDTFQFVDLLTNETSE